MNTQAFIENFSLSVPGFLLAIVFHEYAHAWMAKRFGDNTAELSGRMTFNPMAHYDLMGTVIFPLFGALIGGVMFGWAKPVPVDPRYFKNVRSGVFWVSFAGPLANILLAVISTFIVAFIMVYYPTADGILATVQKMAHKSLWINMILAVFNLIPFPPLDGSKMVSTFLDYEAARKYEELGRYSFVFILLLWFTNIFSYLLLPAQYLAQGMLVVFLSVLG